MLPYYVLVKDTNFKVFLPVLEVYSDWNFLYTFLYSFELNFWYCIEYVPLNTYIILFLHFCENIAIILFLHSSAILLCFVIENSLCLFPVLVR